MLHYLELEGQQEWVCLYRTHEGTNRLQHVFFAHHGILKVVGDHAMGSPEPTGFRANPKAFETYAIGDNRADVTSVAVAQRSGDSKYG